MTGAVAPNALVMVALVFCIKSPTIAPAGSVVNGVAALLVNTVYGTMPFTLGVAKGGVTLSITTAVFNPEKIVVMLLPLDVVSSKLPTWSITLLVELTSIVKLTILPSGKVEASTENKTPPDGASGVTGVGRRYSA